MDAQTAFLDCYVRPCLRDQFGLRDNLTGVFKQRNQDVVSPATKWIDLVHLSERALGDIELEWAKPKPDCTRQANLLNRHEFFRQDLRRFDLCPVRRQSCANTPPAHQGLAETSSSNKLQCVELAAPSCKYETVNTCLANRRSRVSRPSRNFAWVACKLRHAASFRPTDFSAIARLVAALSSHDKLACLADSSSAPRQYCLATASPSSLPRASSPLMRRNSAAYHCVSSRLIFARSKTASPCRGRPATAAHLASSACRIQLKTPYRAADSFSKPR